MCDKRISVMFEVLAAITFMFAVFVQVTSYSCMGVAVSYFCV
jgi:hypothetical protein